MPSTALRARVAFHRLDGVADAWGNMSAGYAAAAFLETRGDLRRLSGREREAAGRTEAGGVERLRIRNPRVTLREDDLAVINGVAYQIRAILPDRVGRWWELDVERGASQAAISAGWLTTEAGLALETETGQILETEA